MSDDVIVLSKMNWLTVIGSRIKKLYIDFTSIKNWALGFIIYGFFHFPGALDSWVFGVLVLSILGIKEAVPIIAALKGFLPTSFSGTVVPSTQQQIQTTGGPINVTQSY